MVARTRQQRQNGTALAVGLLLSGACSWNAERTKLVQEVGYLRDRTNVLDRLVAERDAALSDCERQIDTVTGFGSDRPADMFAPVSLEIASLSRGRDYDGIPGDDGVTVHLRPKDADGDAVKAPGTIRIQLVDNTDLGAPQVIKVYVFEDLDQLRGAWHSRFGTQHYTLRCPFPADAKLPGTRHLTVTAEFVDYLTGRTLRASKDVRVSWLRR